MDIPIEGIPAGYEAVRYGLPITGERYVRARHSMVETAGMDFTQSLCMIIKKTRWRADPNRIYWFGSNGGVFQATELSSSDDQNRWNHANYFDKRAKAVEYAKGCEDLALSLQ